MPNTEELETLGRLLRRHKYIVRLRNNSGETFLHAASEHGHIDLMKLLLSFKADVNAEDQYKFTPLCRASRQGHKDAALLLLANKAEVNRANGNTPLGSAIFGNQVEIAKILVANGANLNSDVDIWEGTLLHRAVKSGFTDMVRFLIDNGADVNSREHEDSLTPLHLAAYHGLPAIARLLISAKADINAKSNNGMTLLSFTVGTARNLPTAISVHNFTHHVKVEKRDEEEMHLRISRIDDVAELLRQNGAIESHRW